MKTLEGQDSTEEEETMNWGEVYTLGMEQWNWGEVYTLGMEQWNWGEVYTLGMEHWKEGKPLYIDVSIEGQSLKMQLDTGTAVSLLPY